ncbi:hypothetical protein F5876DRAFT_83780 [Lentinula aff. lateritia]|uniref:Uncharacterized protein n=1 Tax=Lentinula aff. lateritia TaxID=2804960 RepID=A0ACC1THB2_9AGAR|nr:hypothetical protein F5876DRAFT_83780 [Lentinula aff. lateritia]
MTTSHSITVTATKPAPSGSTLCPTKPLSANPAIPEDEQEELEHIMREAQEKMRKVREMKAEEEAKKKAEEEAAKKAAEEEERKKKEAANKLAPFLCERERKESNGHSNQPI